ncbi:MAG TPA: YihY/virulence factor BrkB family protein [Bacteroidia bacterium]|nr:YihY/virulence factor BrkB family protein [Bacteroidia bacterium]
MSLYLKNIVNPLTIFWKLLKEATKEFISDNAIKLSAALSYYTVFSLPPLLIIIISLCGIFLGGEAVRGQIFFQIKGLLGNETALQIQETIKNISLSGNNIFATISGVVILLIGASGVFGEIQTSINYIWGIEAKPKLGLAKYLKNRLMSFSMIGAVSFLLLVGLIINSLMDILSHNLMRYFPEEIIYLSYAINMGLVLIIITFLFVLIFRTLPDGKIRFRDCIIGASFTSLLFIIGKVAIGFYLSNTSIAAGYGAAGSVVVILVWVYYSAIILYFGAEFTKVYAYNSGHGIIPNRYSIHIQKEKGKINFEG